MINNLIFDWGGVLGEDNNEFASSRLSKKYNIDRSVLLKELNELENDKYLVVNDIENSGFYKYFSEKYNIPLDEFINTLNNVPHNSTFEYIKQLRSKVNKMFILSNQLYLRARAIENMNDLSIFDGVFFSCDLGVSKPSQEMFRKLIDTTNIEPNYSLFIDDKILNLTAASKIGFSTFHYKDLGSLKAEILKYL